MSQPAPLRQRVGRTFHETLKYGEVCPKRYQPLAEAKANLLVFIEDVYNAKRLHVSLGYRLQPTLRNTTLSR